MVSILILFTLCHTFCLPGLKGSWNYWVESYQTLFSYAPIHFQIFQKKFFPCSRSEFSGTAIWVRFLILLYLLFITSACHTQWSHPCNNTERADGNPKYNQISIYIHWWVLLRRTSLYTSLIMIFITIWTELHLFLSTFNRTQPAARPSPFEQASNLFIPLTF